MRHSRARGLAFPPVMLAPADVEALVAQMTKVNPPPGAFDLVCDRCGRPTLAWTMSMFNLEQICMDCKERERKHPSYALAAAEEFAACQRGDYNFPGIGRPVDL